MKDLLEREEVKNLVILSLLQASTIQMANHCLKLHYEERVEVKSTDKDCSVFRLLYDLGLKVVSKNTDSIIITDGEITAKVMYKHSFSGDRLDFNSITLC